MNESVIQEEKGRKKLTEGERKIGGRDLGKEHGENERDNYRKSELRKRKRKKCEENLKIEIWHLSSEREKMER